MVENLRCCYTRLFIVRTGFNIFTLSVFFSGHTKELMTKEFGLPTIIILLLESIINSQIIMLLKLYKNAASTGIKCVNAFLMTSSCTSSLGKQPDNFY